MSEIHRTTPTSTHIVGSESSIGKPEEGHIKDHIATLGQGASSIASQALHSEAGGSVKSRGLFSYVVELGKSAVAKFREFVTDIADFFSSGPKYIGSQIEALGEKHNSNDAHGSRDVHEGIRGIMADINNLENSEDKAKLLQALVGQLNRTGQNSGGEILGSHSKMYKDTLLGELSKCKGPSIGIAVNVLCENVDSFILSDGVNTRSHNTRINFLKAIDNLASKTEDTAILTRFNSLLVAVKARIDSNPNAQKNSELQEAFHTVSEKVEGLIWSDMPPLEPNE